MYLLGGCSSWEDMGVVPVCLRLVCLAWDFFGVPCAYRGTRFFRLSCVPIPIFSSLLGVMGPPLFPFFSSYTIVFGGSGVLSQGADSSLSCSFWTFSLISLSSLIDTLWHLEH